MIDATLIKVYTLNLLFSLHLVKFTLQFTLIKVTGLYVQFTSLFNFHI